MAAPASAAPTAASAISSGVTGRCGDIEGVWMAPVTAQVMMTLRLSAIVRPPWIDPDTRANRRLVRTVIAAVAEVGPGILGGDAVERRADRPVQGVDVASGHAAQLTLHLRPGRLDRAQVGRVGGQVAV